MKNLLLLLCCFLSFTASSAFSQTTDEQANKNALAAVTRGQFADAIAILDKDIRGEKNLFASYLLRADVKRMTGDFAGALADLNSAAAIKPNVGGIYERRADIRMVLRHDMKDVLADLDLAISNGVKHERVFTQRGQAREWTGDHEGAIADYKTATGMRPGYAQAYVGWSGVYRRKNDNENAIKVLEEFIAIVESSSPGPKPAEGKATVTTNVDLPVEKSTDLQRGQQTVVIVSGTPMSARPSPDQMRAMTDQMEQSKNTALAYITLADLYEDGPDLAKARETVEKGIALDPSDFYGLDVRGRIKIKSGDLNGGIRDLSTAIAAFPPNAGPYLERGIAYMLQGKDAEAQADFDRYLQLVPKGKANLEKRISEAKASKP